MFAPQLDRYATLLSAPIETLSSASAPTSQPSEGRSPELWPLAAIAAVVILPLGTIAVEGGYEVLINALAVCIVGGLGSTVGILVASVLIGYSQTFTANYLEPHWMMLVSLIAIAIVLVVKPSGLFSHQKELEERI